MLDSEFRGKYSSVLNRKLSTGVLSGATVNFEITKYAFTMLLVNLMYPKLKYSPSISPILCLNTAITAFGMLPEEKYYIYKVLTELSSFESCQRIVDELFDLRDNSICRPVAERDIVWSYGFHTEHGRNKKSIQNEDSYTIIPTKDNESLLFMVADGCQIQI